MRFTCTSWSWSLLSFENVIRVMRILGFETIDVGAFAGFCHFEPTELASNPSVAAASLNDIAHRHGVAFTDLFVTFGKDLADRCVNSPEPAIRNKNAETLRRLVDFCNLANIPGITLCPGIEHTALGRRASLALATEELARLAEIGHRGSVRISFEPHLESVAESPADTLSIVKGSPYLSLTLDYSHFIAQGYETAEVDPLLSHAGHLHVRQAKGGTLQARDDDGVIDFERILAQLDQIGYMGAVAFEYEWNSWQGNNRVDVLSETLALRHRLSRFAGSESSRSSIEATG